LDYTEATHNRIKVWFGRYYDKGNVLIKSGRIRIIKGTATTLWRKVNAYRDDILALSRDEQLSRDKEAVITDLRAFPKHFLTLGNLLSGVGSRYDSVQLQLANTQGLVQLKTAQLEKLRSQRKDPEVLRREVEQLESKLKELKKTNAALQQEVNQLKLQVPDDSLLRLSKVFSPTKPFDLSFQSQKKQVESEVTSVGYAGPTELLIGQAAIDYQGIFNRVDDDSVFTFPEGIPNEFQSLKVLLNDVNILLEQSEGELREFSEQITKLNSDIKTVEQEIFKFALNSEYTGLMSKSKKLQKKVAYLQSEKGILERQLGFYIQAKQLMEGLKTSREKHPRGWARLFDNGKAKEATRLPPIERPHTP